MTLKDSVEADIQQEDRPHEEDNTSSPQGEAQKDSENSAKGETTMQANDSVVEGVYFDDDTGKWGGRVEVRGIMCELRQNESRAEMERHVAHVLSQRDSLPMFAKSDVADVPVLSPEVRCAFQKCIVAKKNKSDNLRNMLCLCVGGSREKTSIRVPGLFTQRRVYNYKVRCAACLHTNKLNL